MKNLRHVKLIIGCRFGIDTIESKSIDIFLSEISSLEIDRKIIPMHWNMSLSPLLDPLEGQKSQVRKLKAINDLIIEIKTRIKRRGDMVIPSGFRGAVHPLLEQDELDKELSWCEKNPWMPGFKQLFGMDTEIIMPVYPDLQREIACGAYSRKGFKYIGLPADLHENYRFRIKRDRVVLFYYIPYYYQYPEHFIKILKRHKTADNILFILFDIKNLKQKPESGLLRPFLKAFNNRFTFEFASLRDKGLFPDYSQKKSDCLIDIETSIPSPPFLCSKNKQADALRRKKNKNNSDFRRILDIFAPESAIQQPVPRIRKQSGKESDIVLISQMIGSVTLSGRKFNANFVDGRFSGISMEGNQFLTGLPAYSYITIAKKKAMYETVSAFSFESFHRARRTGLRTAGSMELPGQGGMSSLAADYYFYDSNHELFVDLSLSFPEWNEKTKINEIVPFEIPISFLHKTETIQVRAFFSENISCSKTINIRSPLTMLFGKYFTVSKGGTTLTIKFNHSRSSGISFIQFLIKRFGRRYILCANLCGSYLPVDSRIYSGIEDQISFTLDFTAYNRNYSSFTPKEQ